MAAIISVFMDLRSTPRVRVVYAISLVLFLCKPC